MTTRRPSVVLTAGYSKSPAAIALAQLLLRDSVSVRGILLASPYSFARLTALVRANGRAGLWRAIHRLWGRPSWLHRSSIREELVDPIDVFLAAEGLDASSSLSQIAKKLAIPLWSVSNLNDAKSIDHLRRARPDGVIYCGGGILKAPFLEAVSGRVLNAHAGPLPEVRGMNAAEWAVLLGLPQQVTIHFIDDGLDTGKIVERVAIALESADTLDRLRSKAVVAGIIGLRRNIGVFASPASSRPPPLAASKQVFALAPALRDLAARRLARLCAQA